MKKDKENTVSQPHDKIVKRMLSNPAAARDILNLYLPKEVLSIVDLNFLELQRDSFIDDEHRAFAVDLLFKTAFQGKEGYLWILVEHQRKDDVWMPVRVFKYIATVWDHLMRKNINKSQARLPLIYPIIIYNGDKPYSSSLTLSDLIEPTESKQLFKDMFAKPIPLIDLTCIQDEELKKNAQFYVRGICLLMALKHVFDHQLQVFIDQIMIYCLVQLEQIGDVDEVIDIISYLSKENNYLDKKRFWQGLYGKFSEETEGKMTTIAQQMRQEGIEKEKIEIAKRLLDDRHDLNEVDLINWVKKMTGLSEEKIRELKKKH